MTTATPAGDAYDAELLGALADAIDRADPVPPQVVAGAYRLGESIGRIQHPRSVESTPALADDGLT